MKFVVVTGGVVSGIGKGITSSSVGLLLRECGLRVTSIKIDPYLNVDAGTMSPYEHGEVFVLNDGSEVDLDLGNYERFLGCTLTRDHSITTGKIYQHVIERERRGEYLGHTVQAIPHLTDAIQEWFNRVASIPVDGSGQTPDVCLVELGGTVGDIEGMIFLEALRQLRFKVGSENFCLVHVSLVPVVGATGEPKAKPTYHSVRELRTVGLHPDIIVCRSTKPLDRSVIGKISMFSMVPATHILSIYDVSNLYKVPLLMLEQRMLHLVLGCLRLNRMAPEDIPRWRQLAARVDSPASTVTIGIVGKYTGLADSYLSVSHALQHAALDVDVKLRVEWVESAHLEPAAEEGKAEEHAKAWRTLQAVDGILVPGGFGDRGIDGKILAIRHARTKGVPFLGVCLGMQMAVIEFAREVLELKDANSTEFDAGTEHPVVMFMPEVSKTHMGGTMRLGARTAQVAPDSLCSRLYDGAATITERHRHRYEVNPEYVPRLRAAGLIFSATDGERMEVVELDPRTHPFFFGTQFHPEFLSRPMRPSPPFRGFVRASAKMPPAAPIVTRKPSPMSTPSPSKSSGSGAETPSPASSPSSK